MSEVGDSGLRNTLYGTATRSGRRMTAVRRFLYALAVPVGLACVRAFWLIGRVVRVEGVQHLDAALAPAPLLVPCYWHQHLLSCGTFAIGSSCYVPGVTDATTLTHLQGEMEQELKRLFGVARAALETH